jgi:putative cell wall-binding protein
MSAQSEKLSHIGGFGSIKGGCMMKNKFNKKLVWLLIVTLLLCLIPAVYVMAKTVEAQEAKIVFFYVANADGKDVLVRAAPIDEIRGLSHQMPNGQNYGFSYTDNLPTTGYAEAQGFTTDELIDYLNNYLATRWPEMGTLTYRGKDRMYFMADDSEGLWTRSHTSEKLNSVERKYVKGLYDGWRMFHDEPTETGGAQTWEVDDIDELDPATKEYKETAWAAGEPMPVILSTHSNSGRVLMYHDETSAGIGRYVDENGGVVRGCLKDALDYDKALTLYIPTSEHEFMMGKRTAYENFKWIYAIKLKMENPPTTKSKGTVPAAVPTYELKESGGKTLLTVILTSPMEGATIYYNDGTNPSENSAQTKYKEPFTIDVTGIDLVANPIKYYTRTVREGYDDLGPQNIYYYQTAPSFQRDSGDGFLGKDLVFKAESSVTSEEWNVWIAQLTKITLQYPNGTSRDLTTDQYRIDNKNKTITLSKGLFTTTGTHAMLADATGYATRTATRLMKGMAPKIIMSADYPMYEDIVLTFDDATQAYQTEITAKIDGKAVADAYLDRSKPGKLTIKANYFATGALNEPGKYALVLSNINYLPEVQTITLTITPGTPGIPDLEPECQDGVYLLADADNLLWFAEQVNVKGIADLKGRLTGNINLNSASWIPIGIDAMVVYSGTFDGNGFQIFGLNINSDDNYQGLFGYVKDATIKNLTVSGQVNGRYCSGGIVGQAMNSTIDNCVNKAAVQSTVNSGGIVGNALGSSAIQYCSNEGSISGTQYAGGICGQTSSTTCVQKCINSGSVNGSNRVGGIAGGNLGIKDGISVDQCVNHGDVSANGNNVGGISGYVQKPVSSCYNTGTILGKTSDANTGIGGIAGYVDNSQVTNCYNIGLVSCSADAAATRIGSIAGIWASNLTSKGNYYLQSDAVRGIGYCTQEDKAPDATESKIVEQIKALAPILGDAYVADTDQINGGYPVLAWQSTAVPDERNVKRLAGDDRYATAVKVSQAGWATTGTVILARGDDFADAVAGVPLAHQLNAPILLTQTNSIVSATIAEITRLKAERVIILGGPGAISDDVMGELEGRGLVVERIQGADRYETAVRIAERLASEGAEFDTAIIAVGTNFADALAASSYAAMRGQPILLTDTNYLPQATKDAIAKLGIKNTVVCGGPGAVSESVFAQLPNPKRVFGNDRYLTALELAKEFMPKSTKHVYVATGLNFPDAVAGGVLAAKNNSGVLLVQGNYTEPIQQIQDYYVEQGFTGATMLGGSSVVSSELEQWFKDNLR